MVLRLFSEYFRRSHDTQNAAGPVFHFFKYYQNSIQNILRFKFRSPRIPNNSSAISRRSVLETINDRPHRQNLARFLSSNAQWADDVGSAHPQFFLESAKGQSPKVLWIGCADSRVPESVIMGCKPGDIFVHRNIANQFHLNDDSAHAVLAYAVGVLGVEHVVVVGHTNCGGVHGAFEAAKAAATNSEDTALTRWLGPLVNLSKEHMNSLPEDKSAALKVLVEENVKAQVQNVAENPVMLGAWEKYAKEGEDGKQKKVYVHGWVYGLEDGRLRDLGVSHGPQSSKSSDA